MKGVRTVLGRMTISNAMATFMNTIVALEDGIKNLQHDKAKHHETIQESNLKITELHEDIEQAERVLNRIKAIIE